METQENEILNMRGGRAYPNAVDGMPQSVNDRIENKPEDIHTDDDENSNTTSLPTQGSELNQAIVDACEDISVLKSERKSLNAQIQAVIESIEAKGIPRKAFKMCLINIDMTEDQRAAFDLGVVITRGAVGFPIQVDLFSPTPPVKLK